MKPTPLFRGKIVINVLTMCCMMKSLLRRPKPGRTLMAMQRRVGELLFSTSTRRCARLRRGRHTTILRCGTARQADDAPKDAASLAPAGAVWKDKEVGFF
ncbi:unnamed protein product [Musa acuminata subsp. burmannicoides]